MSLCDQCESSSGKLLGMPPSIHSVFSSYQSAVCFISGGTKVGCMLVQEYLEGQTSKKRVKNVKNK